MYRCAQQRDLHEVIDVPGLQAGVLPIVNEGQELLGCGLECGVMHLPKRLDQTSGDHGDSGRPSLGGHRCESGEVAAARFVGDLTPKAELERAGDEGRAGSGLGLSSRKPGAVTRHLGSVGHHGHGAWHVLALGIQQVQAVEVTEPGVRDTPVRDRLIGGEWPRQVVADVQVAGVGTISPITVTSGTVDDVAAAFLPRNGEVLLAAFAAEGQGVEGLARLVGNRDLVAVGDVPGAGGLQGDVDVVSFGKELVDAEGK